MTFKLKNSTNICLALAFWVLLPALSHAKQTTIYYYFPDSPVSNLSQLKTKMEAMFAESQINVVFQPFAQLRDFENQQKLKPPDVLISPLWANESMDDLESLLHAYRDGQATYNKLLITRKSIKSSNLIGAKKPKDTKTKHKKTIALTTLGRNISLPSQIFDGKIKQTLDNAHIIEVVKDIDAVFAVALKQVDMALVTKSTLEKLKEINPRLVNSIDVIAESHPLPLPDLIQIVGKVSKTEILKLTKFLQAIKHRKSNTFKRLLSIDEWRAIK